MPEAHSAITPYLIIEGAGRALAWYKDALNATELMRIPTPDGRVGHAEIEVAGSRIMLADEAPEYNAKAPGAYGGSPISLHLSVPNVDEVVAKAAAAGATVRAQPENKFYGERMATIVDPFGHIWHVATHVEDVTLEEIQRRMAKLFGKA